MATDEVYHDVLADAGEYILQHSPMSGAYGFAGMELGESGLNTEVLGLGGYDIHDGAWYGFLGAGGAGPAAVGVEWTSTGGCTDIELLSVGAVGGFLSDGGSEYGLFVYGHYGDFVYGGGIYGSTLNIPNLFNPEYWTGSLPLAGED